MASLVGHAKSYGQDGLETGIGSSRKYSSHFDHKSDVICQMECLRDSTVKQMTFLANSSVLVSTGLLVAAVVIKAVKVCLGIDCPLSKYNVLSIWRAVCFVTHDVGNE
jgi:hypothetical protein